MKLLYCKKCYTIFQLCRGVWKKCTCGMTHGIYTNDLYAKYKGIYAVPLGFDNRSFLQAVENQPSEGMGERFEAFVIPKSCPTFVRKS